MTEAKHQNLRVEAPYNKMLNELSAKRKAEKNVVKTKQDIVAELISKQHKREIKQWVEQAQHTQANAVSTSIEDARQVSARCLILLVQALSFTTSIAEFGGQALWESRNS